MVCHSPAPKKVKKQGEMPLPSLSPIPFKNVEIRDGMGLRLGNGISPCFMLHGSRHCASYPGLLTPAFVT